MVGHSAVGVPANHAPQALADPAIEGTVAVTLTVGTVGLPIAPQACRKTCWSGPGVGWGRADGQGRKVAR